jgi:GNAT superfamily N-acetyltransferase
VSARGGEPADPIGRAATEADLTAVVACLRSGFFEDPVWGDWAFPDPSNRALPLGRLMHFWAQPAIRHHGLRMTARAEAVAVWIPPHEPELTAEEEIAFGILIPELFGDRAKELEELFVHFEEHHPSAEPHYYLSLWATHRDHAGQGIGTALIEESLAHIDAEQMPAYLESTNPANLPRYEALGFRPRSQFGPPGGPVITTMWREVREE